MGELFIFKCRECDQEFEMFHLISEPVHKIFCPECGNTNVMRITSLEHRGAVPQAIRRREVQKRKHKHKEEKR